MLQLFFFFNPKCIILRFLKLNLLFLILQKISFDRLRFKTHLCTSACQLQECQSTSNMQHKTRVAEREWRRRSYSGRDGEEGAQYRPIMKGLDRPTTRSRNWELLIGEEKKKKQVWPTIAWAQTISQRRKKKENDKTREIREAANEGEGQNEEERMSNPPAGHHPLLAELPHCHSAIKKLVDHLVLVLF